MTRIGDNIRKLREAADMSQEQLGKRIGKTRSAVSQYESGTIIPRMGVIEDLANVFGVSKFEIISDSTQSSYSIYDTLSPDERELLSLYAKLDGSQRARVLDEMRDYAIANDAKKEGAARVAGMAGK